MNIVQCSQICIIMFPRLTHSISLNLIRCYYHNGKIHLINNLIFNSCCCIYGFLKYTQSVCWWRLVISAGASHLHVSFSLTPEN